MWYHTSNSDRFSNRDLIRELDSWIIRCQDARNGHYKNAERFFNISRALGYILVYSTIFITVFSLLPNEKTELTLFLNIKNQHVIILISCIAAAISGIVTQARYGERAETHRLSGARYSNLVRNIEELKVNININALTKQDIILHCKKIIMEWNALSEDSLLTPFNKPGHSYCIHAVIILLFTVLFFRIIT